MMALFKIGYAGPLVFELPDHGDAGQVLDQAAEARDRLRAILNELDEPLPFED
jgi:hypothetical protein